MFSVNNFYDIFNSHYGWPKKNNSLWVFSPHGSKDWLDLHRYGAYSAAARRCHPGAIIMHDQEPFFKDSVTELRNNLLKRNFSTVTDSWISVRHSTLCFDLIEQTTHQHTLPLFIRSTELPIICHSEQNSSDIQYLKDNMVIPCYYWWHGMIARDWFRHWERHSDLGVYNKSNASYRFLMYCRATCGTREYRKKVLQLVADIGVLGSTDVNNPGLSANINTNDANAAAIQIVAETLFNTDKIYLTEKVFKPMVMSQPFIMFSAAGSLDYLRSYGFKTYNSVWDETYDTIKCHADRLATVNELIHYLNSLSDSEFSALYEKTLPITEFNRQRFFSQEFQQYLWDELQNNMNAALDAQQKAKEEYPGGTDFYYYNLHYTKLGKLWPGNSLEFMQALIDNNVVKKDQVLRRYPAFRDLLGRIT